MSGTLYDVAKSIPHEHRKSILLNNHINKALISFEDRDMMYLWFYWANFVEPESDIYKYDKKALKEQGKVVPTNTGCLQCLGRLLEVWMRLEPILIEVEVEHAMLHDL
jgi:hypothetical protein